MAAVDLVLLVILLASVALGIWRGLVFEVLSVAGWVCAFFMAQWYADAVAAWLPLQNTAEPLRYAAGFAVVFVGVAFAAAFLSWLIKKSIEKVGLRPVDRALGAVFGLLRGAVLLLALALVVNMTPWKDSPTWRSAVAADVLDAGLQLLKGAMPDSLAQFFP
jgi:membrane protein required for colicin V production